MGETIYVVVGVVSTQATQAVAVVRDKDASSLRLSSTISQAGTGAEEWIYSEHNLQFAITRPMLAKNVELIVRVTAQSGKFEMGAYIVGWAVQRSPAPLIRAIG